MTVLFANPGLPAVAPEATATVFSKSKKRSQKEVSDESYHGGSEFHVVIIFLILIKAMQTPLIFITASMRHPIPS